MATTLQTFRYTARSCRGRSIAHRYATKSIGRRRPFSTTPFRGHEGGQDEKHDLSQIEKKANKDPSAAYRRNLESELEAFPQTMREAMETIEGTIERQSQAPEEMVARLKKRPKKTFLNGGEDEIIEDDDDDDGSEDIPTLAHGELEAQRERRHYARLAAWEMPLLSKLAKPFIPPTADMPLRFRYTTYMGEHHPAEKKVVLEFTTADMPDLTVIQRAKLQKLVGVRYNPQKDIVKMSCEMFESQAQNKRYLGDRVDELLKEARDPTDTFEDVPLDTRHHTFKSKRRIPVAWKLTPERKAELALYRHEAAERDQQRMITGEVVDGVRLIEEAWARIPKPREEPSPELLMAGRGGRGKRIAMRR